MCGRYVSVSSPTILVERFGVEDVRVRELEPSYNVTPRADVPVVAQRHGTRVLDVVRWGLVPSWAKDLSIGDRLINARAETLLSSHAFKRAFERRRCIVPADGFYEWEPRKAGRRKRPWFFRRPDGEPLAFAGLWEIWHDPSLGDDAPRVRSCTIITTDANDVVRPVHERMPAVLAESAWSAWLDAERRDTTTLRELLLPAPNDALEGWPVSALVSKPENDGPELVVPDTSDPDDGMLRLIEPESADR